MNAEIVPFGRQAPSRGRNPLMPDLTPTQLRRIADLIRYPPSAADADERWELVIALRKQATDKETRP